MKSFVFGLMMTHLFGALQFVDCQDPILDLPCRELSMREINDCSMQSFFDDMLLFAKGEQSDLQKHVLVGLAAPQIGKSIRAILVDIQADGKGKVSELRLYINPEIIDFSSETNRWYEGCFSTGDVKGVVSRPTRITVKALDRHGQELLETHSGYTARIFQHEIDHLNGIRFPDRISSQETLHIVKAEEMVSYRNQEGWRDWQTTIPQKDWKLHMR